MSGTYAALRKRYRMVAIRVDDHKRLKALAKVLDKPMTQVIRDLVTLSEQLGAKK
jgi:hypothetical protein